jgi:hypothetical protein
MSSNGDQPYITLQAVNYGVASNVNGGLYHRGVAYDVTKKLEVYDRFLLHLRLAESEGRYRVSADALAREYGVSRWYIQRIEAEHMLQGGIADPRE